MASSRRQVTEKRNTASAIKGVELHIRSTDLPPFALSDLGLRYFSRSLLWELGIDGLNVNTDACTRPVCMISHPDHSALTLEREKVLKYNP